MPVYHVLQSIALQSSEPLVRERLIEAATKNDAFRFVARDTITAEVAQVDDIVRLTLANVKIEKAE